MFLVLGSIALLSVPLSFVLFFIFAMFSDAPMFGVSALSYWSNIKLIFILWIVVLLFFTLAFFLRKAENHIVQYWVVHMSTLLSTLYIIGFIFLILSYKSIGGYFGKDYFHLYYKKHIIDAYVDKSSFTPFDSSKEHLYAKDRNNIYSVDRAQVQEKFILKVMEEVDRNSFIELGFAFAKDKDSIYFEGKKIAIEDFIDKESLIPLNFYFAKDKDNAYYIVGYSPDGQKIKIIENADVETFRVMEGVDSRYGNPVAEDKYNIYTNTIQSLNIEKKENWQYNSYP